MKILVLQFFTLTVSRIAVNITVMAKVISDEIMKLKIIVNGDEGQKQILDFERANKTLSLRIKDLTDKQKELSKQRKQDSAEYKANKLEIEKLSTAIADNKKKIDDQIKSMDNSRLTMEQLRKKAADLKLTMNNMNPNSKDFAGLQKDLKGVETRMLELRNGARASGSSISNLADKFNHYSGIATALTATLAGVVLSVQGVIDYNNKLVDAQTKVGKATGMTNEEVKELTKSFSEFKTRTSNMDLLKIAEVGGKLGVPKAEIQAFTQEVDKAYVALGDNFSGGVEAVANKLGKLKGLFEDLKDLSVADAINKAGSALNELDNQGTASAENVSDFALRVGTLPEKLKPSIAETLGLGAAFEESGLNAERASSGYNKFVRVAATETKKFAEVMRISEEEVKKLINQDPLQFFLKFAEGAKGLDATEVSNMLEYLKLNDQEVVSVLGAASENTDRFRKSIETSNQALAEGTSLQTEFNRVNTNTAAIFEKVKKAVIGAFSSETIAKGLNFLITSIANLLGIGNEAEEKTSTLRRTLSDLFAITVIGVTAFFSISTAIAVYNNLIKDSIVKNIALEAITKAQNAKLAVQNSLLFIWNGLKALGALAVNKFATAVGLEATATKYAEIQQKRWNAALAANPIGAVVLVVTALVSALYLLKKRYDESREAAKKNYEELHRYQTIEKENLQAGKDAVKQYKDSIDNLINTIKSEVATKELRKKAYESLIKIHPEFIGTVDSEYRATAKLADIYKELAKQIEISARIKARVNAKQSLYDENEKLRLQYIKDQPKREAEQKARDEHRKKYGKRDDVITKFLDDASGFSVGFEEHNKGVALINQINANTAVLRQINDADAKRITQLQKMLKTAKGSKKKEIESELFSLIGITSSDNNNDKSNYKTDFPSASSSSSNKPVNQDPVQKEIDDRIKRSENANKKLIELQRQNTEDRINLIKDEYEREKQLIDFEENNKLADIIAQKQDTQAEIDAIDALLSKTKNEKDRKKLNDEKEVLEKSLTELGKRETTIKETFQDKRLSLEEKHKTELLKKDQEFLQQKLALLQREENDWIESLTTIEQQKSFLQGKISDEERSKIKTWNDGKQAIQKYYQAESLTLQAEYLQQLVDELEKIPADAITPEQKKNLEEYKNLIAQTAKSKAELKNGTPVDENKSKADFSSFGNGSNTDLLGMSPDQWEAMFESTDKIEGKLQKVAAAITVMKNMMSTYYSFAQQNDDILLRKFQVNSDRKKKRLKAELDAGYINQETYKKLTLEADADLEKKKWELSLKAAKRNKAIAIADAIASTAVGIVGALGNKPWTPLNFALAGIVGHLGAAQVALIASQPLPEAPGAEDGYYPTIREQDGKMFNAKRRTLKSGLYSEPTVLVGEGNKTELVVDSRTLKRINPTIQQEYMREIQRVKGYETGMIPSTTSSGNDQMLVQAMQVMDEVRLELSELRKYGVIARWENLYKAVDQIDQTRDERQRIINKNKR